METQAPVESNGSSAAAATSNGISADEIALYDRQIRLWGMQAQERIRSANVLLVTLKALGNEIAKNLVLAGIGSLTVLDGSVVTEADLGAQFFLNEEDNPVGSNRAQAASAHIQRLNPRVKVRVDADDVRTKDASYFEPFDVVVATDLDAEAFDVVNRATREHSRAFYAAGTHGLYGFIFSDLVRHDFVIQRDVGSATTRLGPETKTRSVVDVQTRREGGKMVELVTKRETYSPWRDSVAARLPDEYAKRKRRLRAVTPALSCLRGLWAFCADGEGDGRRLPSGSGYDAGSRADAAAFTRLATEKHAELGLPFETLRAEFIRSFLQNVGAEVAPVTAILGGQLAQDVINVLGRTQQPIQNTVIFDGNTMEAEMYPLHPEPVAAVEEEDGERTAAGTTNGAAPAAESGDKTAASEPEVVMVIEDDD